MRSVIRFFARLYPKPWRDRYGVEFQALLDDAGADAPAAADVLKGAALMQIRRRWAIGAVGFISALAMLLAWSASPKPFSTPGTNQIYRMDTAFGAMFEFLVILGLLASGAITLSIRKARWVSPFIALCYGAGLLCVSWLTPQTIVSVGDRYCWDLWCAGIQHVDAAPQGGNVAYRAEVSLSVDSDTAQLELAGPNRFFYVRDENGRRFPVAADAPSSEATTVKPGEPVKLTLSFVAPASVRSLYLTGDMDAPVWVRLYFGSDLNPMHRRTLLKVI